MMPDKGLRDKLAKDVEDRWGGWGEGRGGRCVMRKEVDGGRGNENGGLGRGQQAGDKIWQRMRDGEY